MSFSEIKEKKIFVDICLVLTRQNVTLSNPKFSKYAIFYLLGIAKERNANIRALSSIRLRDSRSLIFRRTIFEM